jgi:hypothetical protein
LKRLRYEARLGGVPDKLNHSGGLSVT